MATLPKPVNSEVASDHGIKIDKTRYAAVYVRKASDSNNKHVMIQLSGNTVELSPQHSSSNSWSGASVQVNNQLLEPAIRNKVVEFRDSDGEQLILYYALPNDDLKLVAPQHGFEITFNRGTVKLRAGNEFRDKVRGLCGTYDTEHTDDFTSPNNCIFENHSDFVASYAVPDENCEDNVKSLHERAKQAVCYRKENIYANVVNDRQRSRVTKPSSSVPKTSGCYTKRVQYFKDKDTGKVCFTTRPVVTCSPDCREESSTRKEVMVHCVQYSDAVQHWMSAADNGAKVDFSQKKPQQKVTLTVPQSCTL